MSLWRAWSHAFEYSYRVHCGLVDLMGGEVRGSYSTWGSVHRAPDSGAKGGIICSVRNKKEPSCALCLNFHPFQGIYFKV